MNVHRWRELESSDPATFQMIQKVKALQKLLISKTEEVGLLPGMPRMPKGSEPSRP